MHVNPNYEKLPGSYLFAEIARRVKEYSAANPAADLIKLGIGDVTLPLAPVVVAAMKAAADEMLLPETFRGYGPDFGYDFLVNAIREQDYAPRGVSLAFDEVFISDGAKTDTSAIQELFAADTRIAVTDPVYPVYVDSNAIAGRLGDFVGGRWSRLVYLPCNAENGFIPSVPSEPVDVIYLCYPNNPTGTTLTAAQLKPFVDYAKKNRAIIVYDAAYKAFITSDVPHSIYEVEGAREVAIECCSFSKTAGFTGTRCAYTIIPHEVTGLGGQGQTVELNALWKRRMGTKFNGVSYPIQRAAAAVFSPEGKAQCDTAVRYYLRNAQLIRDGLQAAGYTVFGGVDAPYVWLKTPMDSWKFFDTLLNRAHVVGTPGTGFGPSGEGYFRLTAFNTYEKTAEALSRIQKL
ncbi:MAG TPA: LL-diaminopimelate aminotransferase [Candidatus Limiplasma sp.]|nr:LL-diaminopimelate aminotransferase [Candidatus Limiplasma sp.]HPS80716.1 LL-diaminopimelate aminotransferase [Candidatus Limiplasma sp.]